MKKSLFILTIISILIATLALAACDKNKTEVKDGPYAGLARCLTAKGVKFYGAYWCPHCQNQKKMFGDDMRYVNYVECDPKGENAKPEECVKANVESFPTWVFPGQDRIIGEAKIEDLAQKANCEDALKNPALYPIQTQQSQTQESQTQQSQTQTQQSNSQE
jgi:glutaredoxin